MNTPPASVMRAVLVEEEVRFTLAELSRASRADSALLIEWVHEGVLTPSGESAADWRFGGDALRRARAAARLSHDLELSAAGVAVVLDLLDQIDALQARLSRFNRPR